MNPTKLDPLLLDFSDGRAAQKAKYHGELFPSSAIADCVGNTFLSFFQTDKDSGDAKGIIEIDLESLEDD